MKREASSGALSSRAKADRTVKSTIRDVAKKKAVIKRATSRVRTKTRVDGAFRD